MSCPVAFSFHHGGIHVKDIYKSINWYADVLGFELMHMNLHGEASMVAFLKKGDYYLELFHRPDKSAADVGYLGVDHLGFCVASSDFDAIREHLLSKVVTITFQCVVPESTCGKPGGVRVLFAEDPDGTPVEFIESLSPGSYGEKQLIGKDRLLDGIY